MRQFLIFVGAIGVMLCLTYLYGAAALGGWKAGWRYFKVWSKSIGWLLLAGGAVYLVVLAIIPPL